MQVMEMEMPMMLLFVCNGTNPSSITNDIKQMLELVQCEIDIDGMMPEEFKNQDTTSFPLKLNVPRLPGRKSPQNSRVCDHFCEQGKKAFHLEVAKANTTFFKFLANHAHRMKLDAKYFRKFAKLTVILGNNAPLSICTWLWRYIQGHLNFHLSSTITILGINNLDATETPRNAVSGLRIARLSLQDMLYCIHTAITPYSSQSSANALLVRWMPSSPICQKLN
jgi:hypothetical protein